MFFSYWHSFSVYVFIGEHVAMIDFIKCLQNRNLLRNGEYMVISVDDEIYNPKKQSSIVKRGNFEHNLSRISLRQYDPQEAVVCCRYSCHGIALCDPR